MSGKKSNVLNVLFRVYSQCPTWGESDEADFVHGCGKKASDRDGSRLACELVHRELELKTFQKYPSREIYPTRTLYPVIVAFPNSIDADQLNSSSVCVVQANYKL